jgi:PH domain
MGTAPPADSPPAAAAAASPGATLGATAASRTTATSSGEAEGAEGEDEASRPVLMGLLWKGDKNGRNWNERFVVLFPDNLFYYIKKADFLKARKDGKLDSYKPAVELRDCQVVVPPQPAGKEAPLWPKDSFPVQLVRGRRTFWFAARTRTNQANWVAHLCACTDQNPEDVLPEAFAEDL